MLFRAWQCGGQGPVVEAHDRLAAENQAPRADEQIMRRHCANGHHSFEDEGVEEEGMRSQPCEIREKDAVRIVR